MAAYMDKPEIVQLLLDKGADPNARDAAGNTALMGAVFKGHAGLTEMLLKAGSGIDLVNGQGDSALMFAVRYDKPKLARMLVDAGASPDLKSGDGKSPREVAKAGGNESILECFD